MAAALLLVDVQNDFITGSLAVPRAVSTLPRILGLLGTGFPWAKVIASQDYHPSEHVSFAAVHGRRPFQSAEVIGEGGTPVTLMLWRVSKPGGSVMAGSPFPFAGPVTACASINSCAVPFFTAGQVQQTPGCELHADLEVNLQTWQSRGRLCIVRKGQDPLVEVYSAFEGRPSLGPLLRDAGIGQVVVAGIATDYCVKQTVLSALSLDFQVDVVVDAVCGVDEEGEALREMQASGARLLTLEELAAQWK